MLVKFIDEAFECLFVDVMDFEEDDKCKITKSGIVDVRDVVKNYFFSSKEWTL